MFRNFDINSTSDRVLGALNLTGRFGNREERNSFLIDDWTTSLEQSDKPENIENNFKTKDFDAISMTVEDTRSCNRLLKARPSIVNKPEQPRITSWDAGWNVANAIQGMFVLGLPYAVLHGGYMSLILIVLTAVICCYTGKILIECLYETNEHGIKERVRETYVDVAQYCWGRRIGLFIVNINQLIELLMTCVLYIVISGNLMASSFPHAHIKEQGWSVIAAVVLLPCIFLRNLRTVSKLSMGCSMAQVLILAVTMLYCLTKITHWQWGQISFGIDVERFPVSIGVIVFSYTSQIFLPSLEGNLERRENFNKMLYWSYSAACASKAIFALVCYLTWAHETKEVITDNLPQGFRSAINIMLVIKALLSYPLPYFASVEVLEQTIFTGPIGGNLLRTKELSHDENLSEISFASSSLETSETQTEETVITKTAHNNNSKDAPQQKSIVTEVEKEFTFPTCYTPNGSVQLWAYILRSALVLGTLIMAVCIPHFALLMGLTGSLTGASLAFILPTLFYLQMRWKNLTNKQIILNLSILIMGIVVSISGIYHSIQGLYYSYHPRPILHGSILGNVSLVFGNEMNVTSQTSNEVPGN